MLRRRRGNRDLSLSDSTELNMTTSSTTGTSEHADTDAAFRDMRGRLHAFIARRVESPQTAEDLTQAALLRLLRSPSSELADPTAWLYRVARNVIIDHYRSRHSTTTLDTDPPPVVDAVIDPFADNPDTARREVAQCLRSLIEQLPEPYRSAVTAVDLNGATHASEATRTGLSVPGVKSRVQRGRRQLRQLLTNCCAIQTAADGAVIGYAGRPVSAGCP